MRRTRSLALMAAAGIAVSAPSLLATTAQAAPPISGHRSLSIAAPTRAHLLDAMHGEAKARASYLAYAAQADREGQPGVGRLFRSTAATELGDHFALESGYVQLAGSDQANLKDAINGENYETTTMYPRFEAQARAQGDTKAAALFHEIAADEATHRGLYQRALTALGGRGSVPAPPAVAPVAVPAGRAHSQGATLQNLRTALGGESFASAKYLTYAAHARRAGHPELARLFATIADVELKEHFNGEAALAGLVGSSRANLGTAVTGENYEATTMYPGYARQARAAGDQAVATTLTEIARDEAAHRDAFQNAGRQLRG